MARQRRGNRIGDAIDTFNAAQTREDYERVLAEVVAAFPDLDGESLASARLLQGKCLQVLGRPDDAQVVLRAVLDDIPVSQDGPPPVAHAARLAFAQALQASGRGRE